MKIEIALQPKINFFSPPLFLFLIFGLLSIFRPISGMAQTTVSWYASNGVGMKNRGIIPEDAGKYEWILKQIRSPEKEDIFLYKSGKEYRRISKEINKRKKVVLETLYLGGNISERKSFDSEGNIEEKWSYNEKGTIEFRSEYNYSPLPKKQLISISIFDNTGKKINEDFFSIRSDGSLRKIVRHKKTAGSIPEISIIGRRRSGSKFTSAYSAVDGIKRITHYDKEGRVSKEEKFRGTKLIDTSIWSYKEKENIKTRCIIHSLETGKRTLIIYNPKGLILSEKKTENGQLKERTGYKYNANDQVIEKRYKTSDESGRIVYQYKGDEVSVETLYIGGEIHSKISYISKNKRIEEKYRNNEIVLKIHYVDRVKVLDQFFIDGEMIREKKYK